MRTRLRLFLEWGITFEEEYRVEEQAARKGLLCRPECADPRHRAEVSAQADGAEDHPLR